MTSTRYVFFISITLAALLASKHAAAAYPDKPIRLIVPFAPGGGTDIVARIMSRQLTQALGQPVVVENRPGAGGAIGAEALVRSNPDGYTLIFGAASYATNAALYKLSYDPVNDITPVAMVGQTGYALVLTPSAGITNIKALIKQAKAHPGKLNFGSSGTGGLSHLGMELFDKMAGIKMAHVPYKGTAPAMNDLIGGQIQLMLGSLPSVMPFVKNHQLTALGVTTPDRLAALPEIPAISEFLPGYDVVLWYAIWGPRGMPRQVVRRLNAAVSQSVQAPDVKKAMANEGLEARTGPPELLDKILKADIRKWTAIVKEANVKVN